LGGSLFIVDSGLGWSMNPVLFLILFFWLLWLLFLVEYSRRKEQAGFKDYLVIIGGMIYIPLVLSLFTNLSAREIVFVLLAAAASDTGAYYFGSWWGRRKIWPEVSPKKTWAGSLGGLLLCTVVTLIYVQALGSGSWPQHLALGVLVNIAAQLGDFFQSSLKRWNQVKDSGSILPGHGGILDRMDSILFLLPVYVLFNLIFTVF
ncbi:MAG: phosphatidate cytidylyltransferase, partial [Desulfonatronovibrionaceae bacterium]